MDFSLTSTDVFVLAPVLALALGACLVLGFDLFRPKTATGERLVHALALVAVVAALVLTIAQYSPATLKEDAGRLGPSLAGVWSFRMYSVVGALLVEFLTLCVLLSSGSWLADEDREHFGEYHCLILLFAVGAILLLSAKHLMLAFIGLEIFSVSLYVLCAIRRGRYQGVEAGLKYFLLGAFAAAIFLYGAALLYAGKGNLLLPELGPVSRPGIPSPEGLAALGGGFLFIALFFKTSVVPFHMWTPDVYEGAPTPVTALMSTGTKAAAFFLLLSAAPLFPRELLAIVPALTILTILVGNLGALRQTNVKRLLAYSGIAHAGYLMVGFSVLTLGTGMLDAAYAVRATLFYLAAYGVTNLAALGVVAWLEKSDPKALTLDGLKGLSRRNPIAAIVLALAALSLAGVPPTVGFWAKYQVFAAAVRADLVLLAVLGIVFSVVGLFYYLRIVVVCWFEPAEDEGPIAATGIGGRVALALCGIAILAVGLLPDLWIGTLVHIKL